MQRRLRKQNLLLKVFYKNIYTTNNLASGNIRFIVMMDEIEPHLKDMVRFINQKAYAVLACTE